MTKILKISFLIFFFSLFFCTPVLAANFYFEDSSITLMQGDEFELKAIVDAGDKTLNTIGGRLLIPDEFLEVKEIITGESGINFWVQTPNLLDQDQIIFSGIVPGGFTYKLAIFSTILKAKKIGVTKIFYAKPEAYLHDGLGTQDMVNSTEFKITIEPRTPKSEPLLVKIEDNELPENFQPEIIDATKALGMKYALVFSTTDKKSGIDYYEVMERRNYKLWGVEYSSGKYIRAESPYYLNDQKLKSEILVKAVDKRGNVRIVRLEPSSPISWYENSLIWGIIILLAFLTFATFSLYAKKSKNKK